MQIKRPDDIKSSEITDEQTYHDRRKFLRWGAAGAMALGLGGYALTRPDSDNSAIAAETKPDTSKIRWKNLPNSPYSSNEELTDWDDATSYNNFYELGSGKGDPAKNAAALITDPWSIEVGGEVEKPGKIHMEEILSSMPLEERIYRLRCVETWSMVVPWTGFSLSALLNRFQPTSQAKYVAFQTINDEKMLPWQKHSSIEWPYREGLRMDEAMHPLTILAVGMYGKTLPNQNGAPLRLAVPWKYGFKSIKSIVGIQLLREMPKTTWNMLQPSEYGFYANVNPAVSHPRWSQARERRIGNLRKQETLPFNGYAEQVASLYSGMDLSKYF